MLWVKAFHIVFVASWFAGLFYLPRIFVNLAMVAPGSAAERDRLLLMARKLLRFTTLLAVPALALGEVLVTEDHYPPPDCLDGVAVLGNQMSVVWSGDPMTPELRNSPSI